ncbi:hypothetical protein LPJ73_001667 [Coemansia sp. RSA 2703]|nr:hypothetical protein LPJ73_001667 [Coemansia sp. RSA 2703]KAJ2372783.1 hypothetical protein IW150_003947 [Coemansia sp. RSA 2607]KAJ2395137.1 hypothetical protein GGI05_001724 [Coemansia sp. RSA 2603]
MSAKRPLDDAETDGVAASSSSSCGSGGNKDSTDAVVEPYSSYMDVHSVLVALKAMPNEQVILASCKRAQLTVRTTSLPLAVQQIAVRLVCQLCTHPATDSAEALVCLVQALEGAEPSVRCEIYQTLAVLNELKGVFAAVSLSADVKQSLDACIINDLNHSQHHLRCSSLAILPQAKPRIDQRDIDVFDTVCKYTTDAHPKVRQTALTALLRQHMMSVKLPVEMYDECVVATKDDFEQVRLVAVELLWAISSAYPEHPVVIEKYKVSETIRLLDDAFVKTCDMVNDSSVVVRQRACTILGRFKNVAGKFLLQTFSKQVMSNLRRFVPRGGYSRGYTGRNRGVRGGHAQSAIPTPKGDVDVDSDEFRLLDSGAAGAFVHGLEDEYQEVRDAAIESMTELSIASAEFAAKSVDFLVDMFNDSSDRVRICAVRALVSIGERELIALTEEQLSIALSAIKDASHVMREGIYAFLAVTMLPKTSCLTQLMAAVKANLDRYPEDQMAIYQALRAIGRNHSSMINVAFVRSLLGLSEHYLSREARIDDIVYAGNVILIMNTRLANRQTLATVLPDYVYSHLSYIRDKYPGCLPGTIAETVPKRLVFMKKMLKRPNVDESIAQLALDDKQEVASRAFTDLQEALKLLCEPHAESKPNDGSATALDKRIQVFARLAQDVAVTDETVHQGKQVVLRFARLVSSVLKMQKHEGDIYQRSKLIELASSVMYGAYEIEARAAGLDRGSLFSLKYLRLFAHASWIHAHPKAQYDRRVVDRMVEEMVQRTRHVEQLARANSADIPQLKALSDSITRESSIEPDNIGLFVKSFRPLLLAPPTGRCQYAQALFTQPAAALRRIIEFNYLFPLKLNVEVSLQWVTQRQNVRVVVRLPTQETIAHRPPSNAIKPTVAMHWVLAWDAIPVSLPLSSGESTSVAVDVALRHRLDMPWSDAFIVRGDVVPLSYGVERYYKDVADEQIQGIDVVISSEPYTVKVNPVEFRPPPSAHTRA